MVSDPVLPPIPRAGSRPRAVRAEASDQLILQSGPKSLKEGAAKSRSDDQWIVRFSPRTVQLHAWLLEVHKQQDPVTLEPLPQFGFPVSQDI